MVNKKVVYFLCTGNSCRSQMAEGFGREYAGDRFEIYSAGIEAHGLNPLAVKAMAEIGIDISRQTSDLIDSNIMNKATYVITLCGDANDKCPMSPPNVERLHWGFPDPAKAEGTEEERWKVFQEVRDSIGNKVKEFLENNYK